MGYVLFYIILGMIIPIALSVKTHKKIVLLKYRWSFPVILAFTIVVIVRALAYDTGADYLVYYENYLYNGDTAWGQNREIGFKWLNSILHVFSGSPQLFFAFVRNQTLI